MYKHASYELRAISPTRSMEPITSIAQSVYRPKTLGLLPFRSNEVTLSIASAIAAFQSITYLYAFVGPSRDRHLAIASEPANAIAMDGPLVIPAINLS